MAVGDKVKIEYSRFRDSKTGVEVFRLTDGRGNTIHPYFTQNLMTPDGNTILLTSDRTGQWQLYALDIGEGELTQLTGDAWISPHAPCLDGVNRIAYYWSSNMLKSVNIDTFETEVIYSAPEGFRPGILSITPDGRYLAFAYVENLPVSTLRGRIYSDMLERMYQRPRSVVMRIDLPRREALAVWGEAAWISHVNISPVDPNIILFCHEGRWHLVQRMWIVRADTHEIWPLVVQKKYLERAGHEFFASDGRVVAQYARRDSPSSKEWIHYDIFVNPDGSALKKYRYPARGPGHIKTNSKCTHAVGDRGFISKDFAEGGAYISLIKYEDGVARLKLLCRHNTSWLSQRSHPHPIFTPDDANVIFTSDMEGTCNVYMVPVEKIMEEF